MPEGCSARIHSFHFGGRPRAACSSLHGTFVPRRGIFPPTRTHLTNLGGGGRTVGGLTCLSVRCLSSYLIFSASSSDNQAAVRFAGAGAVDLCAVSDLSTDLSEKLSKKAV